MGVYSLSAAACQQVSADEQPLFVPGRLLGQPTLLCASLTVTTHTPVFALGLTLLAVHTVLLGWFVHSKVNQVDGVGVVGGEQRHLFVCGGCCQLQACRQQLYKHRQITAY